MVWNGGWLFQLVLSIVKSWINQRTLAKISPVSTSQDLEAINDWLPIDILPDDLTKDMAIKDDKKKVNLSIFANFIIIFKCLLIVD